MSWGSTAIGRSAIQPVSWPSPLAEPVALERYAPAGVRVATARAPQVPTVFSFTQLDDYLSCPARYRYRHLLRLPAPPHDAITFGVALHEAVAAFGRSLIQGHPLSDEGMLDVFARAWTGLGFLSREQEEARAATGRAALVRFWEVALRSDRHPLAVEEPFAVSLDGIRLQGRFDRIDHAPQGVVITDFKSSDVRDRRRAGERARASRRMRDAADGIRAGEFTARPDFVSCRFCSYWEICPSSMA